MNRRDLLRNLSALSIGLGAKTSVANASSAHAKKAASEDAPTIIAHLDTGLLRIASGEIVGYQRKGIYTYKGIPYAATTTGAGRFMPATPAESWQGRRSCRAWGPICPQPSRSDGRHNDQETFMFDWQDATSRVYAAGVGEDCLRLNIWTPGINDGKKRPVLFWIHGGGFNNGSGHEQLSYDGENLARRGDAVVVSVNHRLNAFGFLDLSAYGEEYKFSANVGMLDLVSALEWVKANIALFGGDAECVTLFGQSGGGAKVSALTAMPKASGLFHRAIVESGSMLRAIPQQRSRALAAEIVAELALDASSIGKIRDLSYTEILRAVDVVLKKQNAKKPADRLSFGPVLDHLVLPEEPYDGKASKVSANVPMIVGSTLNEFKSATNEPELAQMTETQFEEKVRSQFGDRADEIIRVYRRELPNATPWHRWWQIASVQNRVGAISQCEAKVALSAGPVYLYWFQWQTPILDGTPGAFHCSEISFVFDNTDRCEAMTGGGARPRALAAVMSEAWLQFARTGDPNHPAMPHWAPFTPQRGEVMIFDDHSTLAYDPDRNQRKAVTAMSA